MRLTHNLLAVAQALADNPDAKHWGYDLQRQSGLRSGAMYPLLSRLLEAGWLVDGWEDHTEMLGKRPPRRYYRVTDTGRTELAALLERARADRRFQNI